VAFLRTSTIIDVGLGVSLKDVYVMGSYYQGKVNLYERPEGYPTFKVVELPQQRMALFRLPF